MKINELYKTKSPYTRSNIEKKQEAMAKNLQAKWSQDKKAFAQQNKPISVVDYINRVLPVVRQVNPTFGTGVVNPSTRDEYNLIAVALDTALKATNYWQRQIEKSAGMEPSSYNAPIPTNNTSASSKTTAPAPAPAPGTAPRAPRTTPATAQGTLTFNSPGGVITFNFDGTNWLNPKGQIIKNPKTIANLNAQLAAQQGTTP